MDIRSIRCMLLKSFEWNGVFWMNIKIDMSRALSVASHIMVMAVVISLVLLFVGIGVLIIIHVCIVGRAFRRDLTASNGGERIGKSVTGMSADDLEMLPCFDFKAREKGSSPVDCAVCLENFKMGEKCRLLPNCRHSFHARCVDSWLARTPFCPICRTSATARKGTGEVPQCHGARFESTESPTVVVGIPVSSSNPFPLEQVIAC